MLNDQIVKPQYGARCFSDLPATIQHLLDAGRPSPLAADLLGDLEGEYQTVVLFLIDSFGWRFIDRFRDRYPQLLSRATKITSQFPSTTSAHITCIHTGLLVGQSGIYEWMYYEPQLDAIIVPLLHSYSGTKERDTLPADADPAALYPTQTIYHQLQGQGVTSYVFQHLEYTLSTFSGQIFAGARVRPYKTLAEAMVNVGELLKKREGRRYIYLYYAHVDTVCHKYGPNSPQLDAEIDVVLTITDKLLRQKLAGALGDTLLMITADHGQIEVDPRTTIYINRDPRFAGLERYLRTNGQGQLLAPAGSCRDMFLYVHDELLAEAQAFLSERLQGRADVIQTQELIEEGFFGPPPLSPAFNSRVGNLLILPHRHETVWWYLEGFEMKYFGHHGGLSAEEMEIPLLLAAL